jgi:hypothetical protein
VRVVLFSPDVTKLTISGEYERILVLGIEKMLLKKQLDMGF